MKTYKKSEEWYARACQSLVGGVNSPVRAFKSVGRNPLIITHGEGAYIYDIDGNAYLDLVGSYGPNILGHAHPEVKEFVVKTLEKGFSYGATTPLEIALAEEIKQAIPFIDKIRFVNSGTEAVMSAIRLARAYTGRKKIIKFNGCYHGHADSLLVAAGSGVATLSIPSTEGVSEETVRDTLVAEYNDTETLKSYFESYGEEIAAVIVETVAGNMGVVLPEPSFLTLLSSLTKKHKALLIADEVMVGFRKNYGASITEFKVEPDMIVLGKVIGGGFPVGAYAAREDIMNKVAPLGNVYQAGTLSGNPVAMACGLKTLTILREKNPYPSMNTQVEQISHAIKEMANRYSVSVTVNHFGSLFNPFFTEHPVINFPTAKNSDTKQFAMFFGYLLENGVYVPPSQFEAWFLPAILTASQIDQLLTAIEKSMQAIARHGSKIKN